MKKNKLISLLVIGIFFISGLMAITAISTPVEAVVVLPTVYFSVSTHEVELEEEYVVSWEIITDGGITGGGSYRSCLQRKKDGGGWTSITSYWYGSGGDSITEAQSSLGDYFYRVKVERLIGFFWFHYFYSETKSVHIKGPPTAVEGTVYEYYEISPSPWQKIQHVNVRMYVPGETVFVDDCDTDENGFYRLEYHGSFSYGSNGGYVVVDLEFTCDRTIQDVEPPGGGSDGTGKDIFQGFVEKTENVILWQYQTVTRDVWMHRPVSTTGYYNPSTLVDWTDSNVADWLTNELLYPYLEDLLQSQASIPLKIFQVMNRLDYVLDDPLLDNVLDDPLSGNPAANLWSASEIVQKWYLGFYPKSCGERITITLAALRWLSNTGKLPLKGLIGVLGYNDDPYPTAHFYVRGYYEEVDVTGISQIHFTVDAWVKASTDGWGGHTAYPCNLIWSYGNDWPDYPSANQPNGYDIEEAYFYEWGIVDEAGLNDDFFDNE
ncbi:MAG: hypothetical protein ACFFC7_02450 [Candidatus Hermodarchaeota archaeon]